jgi:hypothetical protein
MTTPGSYSYCTADDVAPLLGDLELASTLDIADYISKASKDVTLWLGARYALPLLSDPADEYTTLLLRESTAELAAAYVILATAQGGEDNRINAYGRHLHERAQGRLLPYMESLVLPGAVVKAQGTTVGGPIGVFNVDSVSPLETYYRYIQGEYSTVSWP